MHRAFQRLVAAGVVVLGGAAWPCSGLIDCPAQDQFQAGVPQNTPGFLWVNRSGAITKPLTFADGGVVETMVVGTALVPAVPLIEGEQYALHHDCGFGSLTPQPFTVVAAAPLPKTVGRLKRVEQGTGTVQAIGGSMCSDARVGAFARFEITASDELTPFLPVATLHLEIDGKTAWSSGVAGRGPTSKGGPNRRLDSVYAQCKPTSGLDPGLDLGFHVARLRAEIPGGPVLEPAEAEFFLDCGGGCGCGAGSGSPLLFGVAGLAWVVALRQRRPGCLP